MQKIIPAVAVLATGLVLAVLLPLIDRAAPLTDLTRAGDRLDLGGGLLVTPPAGWKLERGVRAGADTTAPVTIGTASAYLSRDGSKIVVHLATFAGDAAALLDQVDRVQSASASLPGYAVAGQREQIVTAAQQIGISQGFISSTADGVLGAYAWPSARLGLLIVAQTPSGQLTAHSAEFTAMLDSVAVVNK